MIDATERLTPREREEFEQEKELLRMTQDHELRIAKEEARITKLFRLPELIITLPVKAILAVGIVAAYIAKQTPSDSHWKALKQ